MKIFAFSTFLAIASAGSSPFDQAVHRLRGNPQVLDRSLAARKLVAPTKDTCDVSTTCPARTIYTKVGGINVPIGVMPSFNPTSTVPSSQIDVTDGSMLDWDTTTCTGIPMYESGNNAANSDKQHSADAYFNWDCNTGTLCVLAKTAQPGIYFDNPTDGAKPFWLKAYDQGQSALVPLDGHDPNLTYITDGTGIVAWEACYKLLSSCHTEIEVHSNYYDTNAGQTSPGGRTTSTGREVGSNPASTFIQLDLTCPCSAKAECEINACYSNSECNYDNSVSNLTCAYDVISHNCCVKDEDCSDGQVCSGCDGICADGTTGTCAILDNPTESPPAPESPVPPPTEPAPAPAPDTPESETPSPTTSPTMAPTFECTVDDVSRCEDQDGYDYTSCAQHVCVNNFCTTQEQDDSDGSACFDASVLVPDQGTNDFLCWKSMPRVCEDMVCVANHKPEGEECGLAGEKENFYTCKLPVCNGDGTCNMDANKPGDEYMCYVADVYDPPNGVDRGACDAGNYCDGSGVCSDALSFAGTDVVCRESTGCCDKDDYCTGDSHQCTSTDEKFGAEKTCRAACEGCIDDVPEVCPGDADECPSNIVKDEDFCLIAGQHYDAGSVNLVITDLEETGTQYDVEVCATIKLNEPTWSLQSDDASIKIHMCDIEAPTSNPGGYEVHVSKAIYDSANINGEGYTYCKKFSHTNADELANQVYLAIHLDVTDGTNGETAWALQCPSDGDLTLASEPTTTLYHEFQKPGSGKGPLTTSKGKSKDRRLAGSGGWSKYISFKLCNADCDGSCAAGAEETTTSTTVAAVTTAASTTAAAPTGSDWTCTDSNNNQLICTHTGAVDPNCSNLFD